MNYYDRRIDYYDVREQEQRSVTLLDCFVYIAVDPSGGSSEDTATSRTDKCGWTVCAVDKHDNRFIFEIGERHLDDDQFVRHMYTLNEQYIPKFIGIEKTPHLLTHFRHVEKEKKLVLPIITLAPKGRKKSVRIRAAGTTLGRTYFLDNVTAENQRRFRNWYDEMEHGDDGIDSYAYLDDFAEPPTEEQLVAHKKEVLKVLAELYVKELPDQVKGEWAFVKKYTTGKNDYNADWEAFTNGH